MGSGQALTLVRLVAVACPDDGDDLPCRLAARRASLSRLSKYCTVSVGSSGYVPESK
eukprot:CAMPEP_0172758126 /NCGR_PEP_ID=MMETSP1074-20121228/165145_1 /TAXON_ID=2916 /ORGANISM="Ceratium fusus, Strain PA161109" /LENGTH=56 /DNA_ID=CAMNT_0013591661 /DNA_START=167 /DNA_END=337 /DNA_ORIENTATION=+